MKPPRLARVALAVLAIGCLAAVFAAAAPARGKARTRRPAAVADSNKVLVRVGTQTITQGDVQRRINTLPEQFRATYTTPEGREQLLQRMVEERVWLMTAERKGIAERPQVRQQLEQQRRDLIIRTYLTDVMANSQAVSDSEAQSYYDAHREEYRRPATVTLRHILLKKESDAKRVLQLARAKNAKWDDLVKRWSTDSLTRNSGGSLGTVTKEGQFASIGVQPALAESALELPAGATAGPFHTDRGWHVVRVESVREESVRPFDEVKPIISRQLSAQRQQDFYKERLEEARRSLGVKPDSAAIKSFVSQKKTAREMFNEAQALASPASRIEAYRKLLQLYPESDVSPQAQFMIGFIQSEELKEYDGAEASFKELLRRWPKAELAASAQWMIDHMRSEEAPTFINLDADSTQGASKTDTPAPPATPSGRKGPGSP